MHGKNRRRCWYEKQRYRRVRNFVLTVICIPVVILVVWAGYVGTHMPTIHISNETQEIVAVYDGNGTVVADKAIEDKILAGRYEVVWVP